MVSFHAFSGYAMENNDQATSPSSLKQPCLGFVLPEGESLNSKPVEASPKAETLIPNFDIVEKSNDQAVDPLYQNDLAHNNSAKLENLQVSPDNLESHSLDISEKLQANPDELQVKLEEIKQADCEFYQNYINKAIDKAIADRADSFLTIFTDHIKPSMKSTNNRLDTVIKLLVGISDNLGKPVNNPSNEVIEAVLINENERPNLIKLSLDDKVKLGDEAKPIQTRQTRKTRSKSFANTTPPKKRFSKAKNPKDKK